MNLSVLDFMTAQNIFYARISPALLSSTAVYFINELDTQAMIRSVFSSYNTDQLVSMSTNFFLQLSYLQILASGKSFKWKHLFQRGYMWISSSYFINFMFRSLILHYNSHIFINSSFLKITFHGPPLDVRKWLPRRWQFFSTHKSKYKSNLLTWRLFPLN